MSTEDFPNEGTDRRKDELNRNLEGEAGAIESRRVADEDRAQAHHEAGVNRALINLIAQGVLIALLITSVAGILGLVTARRVQKVEKEDRDVARASAFRLCTRNKVDRAFAHSSMQHSDPKKTPWGPKVSYKLMDKQYLPILNCEPNLRGLGAVPLPREEQQAFIDRWEAGELKDIERGVCPYSKFGQISPDHC